MLFLSLLANIREDCTKIFFCLSLLKSEINERISLSLELRSPFVHEPTPRLEFTSPRTFSQKNLESSRSEKESEWKISELPDCKPDLSLSPPLEFADLIGINYEEYNTLSEISIQLRQIVKHNITLNAENSPHLATNEPMILNTRTTSLTPQKSTQRKVSSAGQFKHFLLGKEKDKEHKDKEKEKDKDKDKEKDKEKDKDKEKEHKDKEHKDKEKDKEKDKDKKESKAKK